jgi:hypothetical protein
VRKKLKRLLAVVQPEASMHAAGICSCRQILSFLPPRGRGPYILKKVLVAGEESKKPEKKLCVRGIMVKVGW